MTAIIPHSNHYFRLKLNLFTAFLLAVFIVQINFAQRVSTVKSDKKVGFIKDDGSWLIEPKFEKAGDFSDGLAADC